MDRLQDHRPGFSVISRRSLLKTGLTVGSLALMSGIGSAKQDMEPYSFDITEADLEADGRIEVSGPCVVANPPEEVTVHVQVRGDRGARAIGDATFECHGSEGDKDTFSVSATSRGTNRFEEGDEVTIHAKAHINPEDDPAIVIRWSWDGELS